MGLLAVTLALFLPAAHAGPVAFQASGTLQDGSTLGGTITIDTATGLVTAGDLTLTGHATAYTTIFNQHTWPPVSPFLWEANFENGEATGNFLTFLFPPVSLIGYPGGILCGISTTCIDGVGNHYFSNLSTLSGGFTTNFIEVDSGSLQAVAPEPATAAIVLIGVAVLGIRRYRLRSH